MPRVPDPTSPIGELLSTVAKTPKAPQSSFEPIEAKTEVSIPKRYQSDDEQDPKLWDLSALYLKNLRPTIKPIWFRRCGMDKLDYNAHPVPKPISQSVNPPELHLNAEYYFKDEVDRGQEKRVFLSSKEQKIKMNGGYVSEPIIDTIAFTKGYFAVTPFRDFKTFVFLMLSPNNANGLNPNKKTPLFERVIREKASFANTPEGIDAMFDAISIVKKASTEMIISACDKLSVEFPQMKTYNQNPSDLRYSLQNLAKTMPREVLEAVGDNASLCKFYIKAAVAAGFIRYSTIGKIWTLDDLLNDPIDPIRVSPDQDETDVLLQYLLTNSHIYDMVIDAVKN